MINTYFIMDNGEQTGPFSHHDLMDMNLQPEAMVLSPIAADWQLAVDLPEFSAYFESIGIYTGYQNYAGFGWRLLAYIIDAIIIQIMIGVITVVGENIGNFGGRYFADASAYLTIISSSISLIIAIFYNAFFEATEMRGSIGKKACGLIVTDYQGRRISFGKAIGRNFAKILSSLLCGIGFLMILWTDKKQGWHDQLAKTYVVRKSR